MKRIFPWLLLILGFGAGVLVGRSTTFPPRAQPRAVEARPLVGEPAAPHPDFGHDPGERPEIPPGDPRPTREGAGRIEIDIRGYMEPEEFWAYIERRDPFGRAGWNSMEGPDDYGDPFVYGDVPPGVYQVWWRDAESRRVGARIRVAEGRVTRIHAGDDSVVGEVPLAEGMGRLVVSAPSPDGRPREDVWVDLQAIPSSDFQFEGPEDLKTNAAGVLEIDLLAGLYLVSVGLREERVRVVAGKSGKVVLDYRDTGDLLLPAIAGVQYTVNFLDRPWVWQVGHGARPEGDLPLHHMRAGGYEIVMGFQGETRTGRVVVAAGRSTRFDPALPPGGLRVELIPVQPLGVPRGKPECVLDGPNGSRAVLTARAGVAARPDVILSHVAEFRFLEAGDHTLRVNLPGVPSIERRVFVAETTETIAIELSQPK